MGINFSRADKHIRKAREHFGKVKDKELAEGLRRLCTGLLRINDNCVPLLAAKKITNSYEKHDVRGEQHCTLK